MVTKKIYFSQIDFNAKKELESILLDLDKRHIIDMGEKKVEISHVHREDNFIFGLFVSTKISDIEPVHLPGDENDYSAVRIPEGKGFANANGFVYIIDLGVLVWEYNKNGLTELNIEKYFNLVFEHESKKYDFYFHFPLSLIPIMNKDALKQVSNLVVIEKVELRIADPTSLKEEYVKKFGSFADIINFSKKMNSTKSISLDFSVDVGESLVKEKIWELVAGFVPNEAYSSKYGEDARVKNKLEIAGKSLGKDGSLFEDLVRVSLNRLESKLNLKKIKIQSDLQVSERKERLMFVAKNRYNEIKSLI